MQINLPLDAEQESYFRSKGWLSSEEEIQSYEKAGEGNMNVVIRLSTSKKNLILKQSRPYVQKYPQISAPVDRIWTEKAFYDHTSKNGFLSGFSPKILDFDENNHLLLLEDLGNSSDFMGIYSDNNILKKDEISILIDYLAKLHSSPINTFPGNQEMKKLNHEHIFIYPFMEDNGFDLDNIQLGLQEISMKFKKDTILKNKVLELGGKYMKTGTNLLHGDFYPGSWLKTPSGLKVIDPEFSFLGDAEFDLGVMIAHLKMAKFDPIQIAEVIKKYSDKSSLDADLLAKYTGVEILRRLIGLAQLPLKLELNEKLQLADEAAKMIKSP
ncbi:5-methylthioribose kinase [Aquiflexum balticum DSM 16537]|uniref:5-methylthioribose kinase n=1 Tax=Aquiflexum balticum DSM 16537 TaxID=758820 RepID=A0A1W2H6V5_9BACT|nr:phosphotransferase [Aquiflexum balticum]SMD44589.1 5-methylthioribose kinase [Aquiflexum balticum DSM 16537]